MKQEGKRYCNKWEEILQENKRSNFASVKNY